MYMHNMKEFLLAIFSLPQFERSDTDIEGRTTVIKASFAHLHLLQY